VIAIFLSAKLLLVELLLLFPLTHFAELSTSLGNFTRHLANQIILAIVLLMGLIWWQFAPGNQQLLSLLATTLLFLGVKLVVISLSALLLNPIFTPRPVIINQPN
jgi:hypothetical protein